MNKVVVFGRKEEEPLCTAFQKEEQAQPVVSVSLLCSHLRAAISINAKEKMPKLN